jgi:hypothetical protein
MRPTAHLARVAVAGVALLGWLVGTIFFVGVGTWAVVQLSRLSWDFERAGPDRPVLMFLCLIVVGGAAVGPLLIRLGKALWWQLMDTVEERKGRPAECWVALELPLRAGRREARAHLEQWEGSAAARARATQAWSAGRKGACLVWAVASWLAYGSAVALRVFTNQDRTWWLVAATWVLTGLACVCAAMPWTWRARGWHVIYLWALVTVVWVSLVWSLAGSLGRARALTEVIGWAFVVALIWWRRSSAG